MMETASLTDTTTLLALAREANGSIHRQRYALVTPFVASCWASDTVYTDCYPQSHAVPRLLAEELFWV